MRCVIYGRVSTDKQEAENQLCQLKEYAARQQWNIVEIITDVCSGGKSAAERAGLNKIFKMAHQTRSNSMCCCFGRLIDSVAKAAVRLSNT